MNYRIAITKNSKLLLAGRRVEGAEELERLLATAMDAHEWRWAQRIARRLSIVCDGPEELVEMRARLRETMRVIRRSCPVDSMFLLSLSRHESGSARHEMLLEARALAGGAYSAEILELIECELKSR